MYWQILCNLTFFFVLGYVDEAGNPVNPNSGATNNPNPGTTENPQSARPTLPSPPSESAPPSKPAFQYPCELSVSQVSMPGFVCKGQLLFEDNFNSEIDKGKIWTPEIKFPGEPVSQICNKYYSINSTKFTFQ